LSHLLNRKRRRVERKGKYLAVRLQRVEGQKETYLKRILVQAKQDPKICDDVE
jgi:hypothetical protein